MSFNSVNILHITLKAKLLQIFGVSLKTKHFGGTKFLIYSIGYF